MGQQFAVDSKARRPDAGDAPERTVLEPVPVTAMGHWFREIPSHWQVRRIKHLVDICNEKLDRRPLDLPYIALEHIESWTGRLLVEVQLETVESSVCRFGPRDVLFGKLRPYLAKAAMPNFEGVCSTELVVLRPGPELERGYLFYTLVSLGFVRWINSLTYGTKMPRVSPEQIASARIASPPRNEQSAIRDHLDRKLAKLDGLIAAKRELIRLLLEQRTARITTALEGYPRTECSRVSVFAGWFREIPSHWQVRRIKHLVEICNDKLDRRPLDLPYIALEHIESWTGRLLLDVQLETVESSVCRFGPQDVLFGKLRPYLAKAAMPNFEGVCSTELVVLRPGPELERRFLFYTLVSLGFVRWINSLTYGTKMPRVSPEQIASARIPFPSWNEQSAISDHLDRELAKLDSLIGRIYEGIVTVQELRTALISAAVTGKIDVREEVA